MSRHRVVIDVEKLRRINCGLGRFSLHLAEGILAGFRDRIEPVFLVPERERSRFVAADLRRELEVGGKPIHVFPLGLAPAPQASPTRPGFLADDRPFLLTVGNALAHKNFHVHFDLVEVLPDQRLVFAGSMEGTYGDFLCPEVARRIARSMALP